MQCLFMQLLRYLCMCTPWNVCLFLQCKQILRMQLLGFLNKYKQECLNEYGCVARMSSSAYLRFVRIQVYGSKAGDIYVCIYARIFFVSFFFFWGGGYLSIYRFEAILIRNTSFRRNLITLFSLIFTYFLLVFVPSM